RHPVRSDREVVEGRRKSRAGVEHHVRDGRWVIRARGGRERQRHHYGLAALHEAARRGAFFRGDEVERAALIVVTPAAPVTQFLEQGFNFDGAESWRICAHRVLLAADKSVHSTVTQIATSRRRRMI